VVIGGTGVLCSRMAGVLAAAGARTVIVGRDRARADAVLERLGACGSNLVFEPCDVVSRAELRDLVAARTKRPVTFGWGPRFLHSTGQFHKGGPAVGVFLQITQTPMEDLAIPGRPFTFGQLITYQAAGDASVLADHGRPVLTLTLTDPASGVAVIAGALR